MKSKSTAPCLPCLVLVRTNVLSPRSPLISLAAQGSWVAYPFFETACRVDFFLRLSSSSLYLKMQDLQGSRAGLNLNVPSLRLVEN